MKSAIAIIMALFLTTGFSWGESDSKKDSAKKTYKSTSSSTKSVAKKAKKKSTKGMSEQAKQRVEALDSTSKLTNFLGTGDEKERKRRSDSLARLAKAMKKANN